jgi:hypothetical protein
MIKAAVKLVTNRTLAALGLQLVNDKVLLALTENVRASAARSVELEARSVELEARSTASEATSAAWEAKSKELEARSIELVETVSGLRAEGDRLRERLKDAETVGNVQRARTQWIKAVFDETLARQRREFGDLIRSFALDQRDLGERRRQIVVMVTSNSQVTQLKALAGSEQLRGAYEMTIIAYVDVNTSGVLDLCAQSGLRLLTYDLRLLCGDFLNLTAEPGSLQPRTDVDAALHRHGSAEDAPRMRDIALFFNEVRYQSDVAATAQRVLGATAADLLILFEDHAEYATGIWINMADRMSVPSVILPYTIADQLEPAEAYDLNENYWPSKGIYNQLAEIAFPHWLYKHRDRWLLRRPGVRLMAAEALAVAPPTPWILNSSRATAIAVESKAMHEHYTAYEIPEAQLVTTGSVTDDLMYRALQQKDELRRSLQLDPGKPVLLCSLPPNQLAVPRPECQFSDFRSLVDFWLNELKRMAGWEIVVKLHPTMRPEDVAYVRTFDIRISDLETTSLIPLCDVYNPSVSSTIRWALACGKPVLNYDVFVYRYREFASEPAVLTVFDRDAFSGALRRLAQDNESLRDLTDKATGAAARWGMNDGRSMDRILGLFDQLVDGRRGSANRS